MELVLYAGNDFVASLPLDREKLTQPGYVGGRKRELLRQNADALLDVWEELEFFLVPEKLAARLDGLSVPALTKQREVTLVNEKEKQATASLRNGRLVERMVNRIALVLQTGFSGP